MQWHEILRRLLENPTWTMARRKSWGADIFIYIDDSNRGYLKMAFPGRKDQLPLLSSSDFKATDWEMHYEH